MTPEQLCTMAKQAIKDCDGLEIKPRVSLVRHKGSRPIKGFPRGELMSENNGSRVYSYDAHKVIEWLERENFQTSKIKV